jgi:hypothetical protein
MRNLHKYKISKVIILIVAFVILSVLVALFYFVKLHNSATHVRPLLTDCNDCEPPQQERRGLDNEPVSSEELTTYHNEFETHVQEFVLRELPGANQYMEFQKSYSEIYPAIFLKKVYRHLYTVPQNDPYSPYGLVVVECFAQKGTTVPNCKTHPLKLIPPDFDTKKPYIHIINNDSSRTFTNLLCNQGKRLGYADYNEVRESDTNLPNSTLIRNNFRQCQIYNSEIIFNDNTDSYELAFTYIATFSLEANENLWLAHPKYNPQYINENEYDMDYVSFEYPLNKTLDLGNKHFGVVISRQNQLYIRVWDTATKDHIGDFSPMFQKDQIITCLSGWQHRNLCKGDCNRCDCYPQDVSKMMEGVDERFSVVYPRRSDGSIFDKYFLNFQIENEELVITYEVDFMLRDSNTIGRATNSIERSINLSDGSEATCFYFPIE